MTTDLDLTRDNVDLTFLCDSVSAVLKLKDEFSPGDFDNAVMNTIERLEILFRKNKEKCLKENKAVYWFKLGQMFNAVNKFRKQAIEPLTKAVKLDPTMVDAWNELGESYWHNNETELAQKCFENALRHERTKLPLRNLSIVMRKLAVGPEEQKTDCIQKGIDYAKEAVNLDLKDCTSWGILGNAYLSAYFGIRQDLKYAKMALSAYKQAEKLPSSMVNTELHYNKAFASKYSELYLEALISLDKALEIEKSWEPAAKLKGDILNYLNEINVHNMSRGKIKPKRLKAMQKELLSTQIENFTCKKEGIKLVYLSEIKEGNNTDTIIVGKVIWNLSQDGSFPFTFGFIDACGDVIVITIYNMTPGRGFIIGDTVVVPEPFLTITRFQYEGKDYSFSSLRVDNPTQLMVNKKRLPASCFTAYSLLTKEKNAM